MQLAESLSAEVQKLEPYHRHSGYLLAADSAEHTAPADGGSSVS